MKLELTIGRVTISGEAATYDAVVRDLAKHSANRAVALRAEADDYDTCGMQLAGYGVYREQQLRAEHAAGNHDNTWKKYHDFAACQGCETELAAEDLPPAYDGTGVVQ